MLVPVKEGKGVKEYNIERDRGGVFVHQFLKFVLFTLYIAVVSDWSWATSCESK